MCKVLSPTQRKPGYKMQTELEISDGEVVFELKDVIAFGELSLDRQDTTTSVSSGTLQIVEHKFGNFIVWRPTEGKAVTVDQHILQNENDYEWTVVNSAVGYSTHNGGVELNAKSPKQVRHIEMDVTDLQSFKLTKNDRHMTLMQKDGTTHSALIFPQEGPHKFIDCIQKYVKIRSSLKDDSLYLIYDPRVDALNESLTALDLFSHQQRLNVWKMVDNFREKPLETTFAAFSKVTDYLLYYDESPRPEGEVADLLHQSFSSLDTLGSTTACHDDGYEVISCLNVLPPRPEITRESPLTEDEWIRYLDEEGRVTDPFYIRKRVFKGSMEPNLRPVVWKFLLNYDPYSNNCKEREEQRVKKVDEYYRMKLQWKSFSEMQESKFSGYRDRKSLIEKDVPRTDRNHSYFLGEGNSNVDTLRDILMTYVMYNFDLGYVQGMSDLLSPLLIVLQNEVDAFWCFVGFMDKVWNNFELDQSHMKQQLINLNVLLQVISPELHSYLESQDSGNLYFCFRWLLVLFKREFSIEDTMRLWEVLWTGLPCPNFHLLICVAILEGEKTILMENQYGFTEILKHINDISQRIDLTENLQRAEAIYHQLAGAKELAENIQNIVGLSLPVPAKRKDTSENGVEPEKPRRGRERGESEETSSIEVLMDDLQCEIAMNYNYL